MGNKTSPKAKTDDISLAGGVSTGISEGERHFSLILCKVHVEKSLVTKVEGHFSIEPLISLKFSDRNRHTYKNSASS